MSVQQASYQSSIYVRITKKESRRYKSNLRRSCDTDETDADTGSVTKATYRNTSETRAENEKRQIEIRDYVFSLRSMSRGIILSGTTLDSLPGVDVTHCNFGKTQVEVWYVTKETDSNRLEEEMQKQIGSHVDPYKLKLVKKASIPTFKHTSPGQSTCLMRRDGSIGAYVTLTDGNRGESNLHALVCGHGKKPGNILYSDLNAQQRIGEVKVAIEGNKEPPSSNSYDIGLVWMDEQRVDRHETWFTMNGERIQLARAMAPHPDDDMTEDQQVMLFKNGNIKGRVRYLHYNSRTQEKFGMIGITQSLSEKMEAVHTMNESGTLVVALSPYPVNGERSVKAVGMLVGIEEFQSPPESISLAIPIGRNLQELMEDEYCANKDVEFA